LVSDIKIAASVYSETTVGLERETSSGAGKLKGPSGLYESIKTSIPLYGEEEEIEAERRTGRFAVPLR